MSVEEIKVHNLSKKKPAKAPVPHSRGRMMDFAPRRRKAPARAPRPQQTVVVTEVEEVVETIVPEAPKPPKPPVPPVKPAAPLGAHVGLMSEAKPMPKPEPRPSTPVGHVAPGMVAPVVPPDYYDSEEGPELTPEAVEEVEPVGYRPIPPSQDPTSPFLSSVNVEKRPLSAHATAEPVEYPRYNPKNIYDDEPAPREESERHHVTHQDDHHKTKIVQTKSKKSKISMVLLIIATALLGVALGVLVYFAIFKQ